MSTPFYINILLLNKDEVVSKAAIAKTGTGFFGKAASYAATKIVTDEKMINKISENIITKIGSQVHEMGIEANLKKVFQKGAFLVIRVEVTSIDKITLLNSAKGPEFAAHFQSLLDSLSSLGMIENVQPTIDEKIATKINEGLMGKFQEMLPLKMGENGVNIDCNVLDTHNQAEFFFETISSLP